MKWMIASDIHGSAYYTKEMLKAFDREGADKLLLLGDILYHGPRNDLPKEYNPKEVITLLNERKADILAVRGNCDTEVDQMVLEFPIMADYGVITMDTKSGGTRVVYVTHGHKYNELNCLPLQQNDILMNGHTHVPKWVEHGEYGEYVYMNPGSISIPKENSEHSYMIVENGSCIWKNLDGESYMGYDL